MITSSSFLVPGCNDSTAMGGWIWVQRAPRPKKWHAMRFSGSAEYPTYQQSSCSLRTYTHPYTADAMQRGVVALSSDNIRSADFTEATAKVLQSSLPQMTARVRRSERQKMLHNRKGGEQNNMAKDAETFVGAVMSSESTHKRQYQPREALRTRRECPHCMVKMTYHSLLYKHVCRGPPH